MGLTSPHPATRRTMNGGVWAPIETTLDGPRVVQVAWRRAMSGLVITSNETAAGDIKHSVPETPSPGDDLTVNPGVVVDSTGGDVTLSAGDEVTIHGIVRADTTISKVFITAGA